MDPSEPEDLHHEGGWPASGSAAAQKPDQIGARAQGAQGAQGALDAEAETSTQSWLGKQYDNHPVVVTLGRRPWFSRMSSKYSSTSSLRVQPDVEGST